MSERFAIAVRRLGDEAVMELTGDLDGAAAPSIEAAWEQASAYAKSRIVLDFAATAYMNSSGIALIVELLGRARAGGCLLVARGLSPHYRQIFEITRLADFIAIEDAAAGTAA